MAEILSDRERELEAKAREVARRKFSDIAVLIYREQTNGAKGWKGKSRGKSPISPSPSILSLPVSPFLSKHAKLDKRYSRHGRDAPNAAEGEDETSTFGTWPKIRERAVNVKAHSLVGSPVVPRFRHSPLQQQTLSVPAFGRAAASYTDSGGIGSGFFKGGSEDRDTSPELLKTPPIFASIFSDDSRSGGAQTAWQCRPVQQPTIAVSAPRVWVPRIEGGEVCTAEGSSVSVCVAPNSKWSDFEPSPTSPGYDRLAPHHDVQSSKDHLLLSPHPPALPPSSAAVT